MPATSWAAVWTGIASLPAPHHGSGLAIILFEIRVEPLARVPSSVITVRYMAPVSRIPLRRASDFLDLHWSASGAIDARGQRSADPDRGSAVTIWCRTKDAVLDFPPAIPIDRIPSPQRTGESQTFE
jgi:hypothetical protein